MKKEIYKDYTKASKYFKDDNEELLQEEINTVESNKKYFVWVQSFSKKVVIITFAVYIIYSILSAIMVYLTFKDGSTYGLDTMISEINLTFREVVGAYIVKSGVENACKIAGNYFVGISDARLEILRRKYDDTFGTNDRKEKPVEDEEPQDDITSEVSDDGILLNSGDTTY